MDDPKAFMQKISPLLALTAGIMFCLAGYLRFLNHGRIPVGELVVALLWFLFAGFQYALSARRE